MGLDFTRQVCCAVKLLINAKQDSLLKGHTNRIPPRKSALTEILMWSVSSFSNDTRPPQIQNPAKGDKTGR